MAEWGRNSVPWIWVTSSHSLGIKEEERKRQPSYSWYPMPVTACLLSFSQACPPCHGESPPLKPWVQHIFSLFSCFFMASCHSNGTANKHTLCWSRTQIQAHWPSKSDLNNFPSFVLKTIIARLCSKTANHLGMGLKNCVYKTFLGDSCGQYSLQTISI